MKTLLIALSFLVLPQHEVRNNRVWTIRIELNTCGIDIKQAVLFDLDEHGELSNKRYSRTDYFFVQWSKDMPEKKEYQTYFIHDLLADYGQKRYLLRLIGITPGNPKPWVKFIWISPVGVSTKPIPPAPIRSNREETQWKTEDLDHMRSWFVNYHQVSHKHFWANFRMLLYKTGKQITIPVNIKSEVCNQQA